MNHMHISNNLDSNNFNTEKKEIISWLSTEINEEHVVFDHVLDIFEEITQTLYDNRLELRYNEDTLLINLIYFLFFNSYTDIKF